MLLRGTLEGPPEEGPVGALAGALEGAPVGAVEGFVGVYGQVVKVRVEERRLCLEWRPLILLCCFLKEIKNKIK